MLTSKNNVDSGSLIFVTGQAKSGRGDAITNVYQIYSLSLIIDPATGIIQDMECTCAFDMTNRFLKALVCGKHFMKDTDRIMADIKSRFLAVSQKTFMAAYRDAQNRYVMEYGQ